MSYSFRASHATSICCHSNPTKPGHLISSFSLLISLVFSGLKKMYTLEVSGMHDTRRGLFRKDYTNKHTSKLFLNKVGSELYYTALEKEKNRLLKIWGKKLNLLKMENKDKNKKRETHILYFTYLLIHSVSITWHLLLFVVGNIKMKEILSLPHVF